MIHQFNQKNPLRLTTKHSHPRPVDPDEHTAKLHKYHSIDKCLLLSAHNQSNASPTPNLGSPNNPCLRPSNVVSPNYDKALGNQ